MFAKKLHVSDATLNYTFFILAFFPFYAINIMVFMILIITKINGSAVSYGDKENSPYIYKDVLSQIQESVFPWRWTLVIREPKKNLHNNIIIFFNTFAIFHLYKHLSRDFAFVDFMSCWRTKFRCSIQISCFLLQNKKGECCLFT